MRLPLIALVVATAVAPCTAQTGTISSMKPPATAAPAPRPDHHREPNPYYYERLRYPIPTITMDSAARVVEAKYQGWFVDSKQLVYERYDPVYFINMITPGRSGTRLVVVDGYDGEVLNPEVMREPSDTATYWRAHRRRQFRPAIYP